MRHYDPRTRAQRLVDLAFHLILPLAVLGIIAGVCIMLAVL